MQNKSDQFPAQLKHLSGLAKALAHPARLQILRLLAECNTCITGDLVDRLPLAQATVSQHLIELKKAGFIRGEIRGPRTCYCLDPETVTNAQKQFTEMFETLISE